MSPQASSESFNCAHIADNEDLWSMVNLNDEANNALWMQQDMWYPTGATTSDSSPSSDAQCESSYDAAAGTTEPERGCDTVDVNATVSQKKAKRQAQNRVAQQAFRARKERLVRGLSVELANLQCQYATTKAQNEQLQSDLRLAQTELAAIRSVLQHAQPSPVRGPESAPFASRPDMQHCSVIADPSSCTLTLKIDIDGLLTERARQTPLLTPPMSEEGADCIDVDLGALCESIQYP